MLYNLEEFRHGPSISHFFWPVRDLRSDPDAGPDTALKRDELDVFARGSSAGPQRCDQPATRLPNGSHLQLLKEGQLSRLLVELQLPHLPVRHGEMFDRGERGQSLPRTQMWLGCVSERATTRSDFFGLQNDRCADRSEKQRDDRADCDES